MLEYKRKEHVKRVYEKMKLKPDYNNERLKERKMKHYYKDPTKHIAKNAVYKIDQGLMHTTNN